jgi:hypothetical protein
MRVDVRIGYRPGWRLCANWSRQSCCAIRQKALLKFFRVRLGFLWTGEVVDTYELKLRRWLRAPIGVISIDSHGMALGARIRDSRIAEKAVVGQSEIRLESPTSVMDEDRAEDLKSDGKNQADN